MRGKFVTNEENILSEVINNILPSTKSVDFLVGFFYFSGFTEIAKEVENKQMRVLVGLDIEQKIGNKVAQFQVINDNNKGKSRAERREKYYQKLRKLINESDIFDSEKKEEAFKIFIKKIKEGSLEIKQTKKHNHSKLYLFHKKKDYSEGGLNPGVAITGSSNFTASGFTDQDEINVIMRDKNSYEQADDHFEKLWRKAVPIATEDTKNQFVKEVVNKTWVDKNEDELPSPYELYLRVLKEYFSLKEDQNFKLPSQITGEKYFDLKYQRDAIRKGLSVINKHDGVIISDVVGLGKSIVASTIAHNLDMDTLIIAPPHLKKQWKDYRYEFNFNGKVYSSGKIDQAVEDYKNEPVLVIIDEAHKYRNQDTDSYANLHKLCHGNKDNKVMLLSATPFNNKPQDIFSLIRLFQIPTNSTIRTVDNLSYRFQVLAKKYKEIRKEQKKEGGSKKIETKLHSIANEIRDIISPLIIRRSRIDLDKISKYREDLEKQGIQLNDPEAPELLRYKLGNLSKLYTETLEKIDPRIEQDKDGFIGIRYQPLEYVEDLDEFREKVDKEAIDIQEIKQGQKNNSSFMRRLLVKRFESSVKAFKETLDKMIESSKLVKNWYEELDMVPVYKKGNLPDVDELEEASGEEVDEQLDDITLDDLLEEYKEKGLVTVPKEDLEPKFIELLNKDIDLLENIREDWFDGGLPEDPKLQRLKKELRKNIEENPDRKIVIFSEYSDTVNYLFKELADEFKVFSYTSGDATKSNKETVRKNFDAGLEEEEQKDEYQILIATDAISEGFNLHRAGVIYNYDIPYNPTRVIQRVGRINRINQKVYDDDEMYIYNFFPTPSGEKEIRSKQITTMKKTMINALLGEDTKVLTEDEELSSFFQKQYEEEKKYMEEESWDTKYIEELNQAEQSDEEQAEKIPKRTRIRREKQEKSGVLVFGQKGGEYSFKFGSNEGDIKTIPVQEAIPMFKAEKNEESKKTSDEFENIYKSVKDELFNTKTKFSKKGKAADVVNKVDAMRDELPKSEEKYLEKLYKVIKELDSLPTRYEKFIKNIEKEELDEMFEQLKEEVPLEYLSQIIEKSQQIQEGEETLILTEEFN
jgi:superfamily II DNA/RNA helicase